MKEKTKSQQTPTQVSTKVVMACAPIYTPARLPTASSRKTSKKCQWESNTYIVVLGAVHQQENLPRVYSASLAIQAGHSTR